MGKTYRKRRGQRKEYRLRVVGVRRDPPDARKLARVIVAMAMRQAEAEARAQRQRGEHRPDLGGSGEVVRDAQ